MAFELHRFPMSYGVVTDEGRCFLGLVNSDGEAAFVVYDLEKNDIVNKLQYMDTRDWRLNKQLEDHPAGISDKGAYFVSEYIISEEEGFCKPIGMEVRAYSLEDGQLLQVIPISEGIREWPLNCRLLEAARLEDDFYLIAFSEKMRSERDFVIVLFDGQSGEISELWRSTGHQLRYFDVEFRPEDLTLTVKTAEEFFYDVYDRNEYDFYTLQLAEDYGACELIREQKVSHAKDPANLLSGLALEQRKLGLLRGKMHRFVDRASGNALLELKEGMNTSFIYEVIPGLETVIVEKSGVLGGRPTYYVISRAEDGFRLSDTIEMNDKARICADEEAGWIALVGSDETVILKEKD